MKLIAPCAIIIVLSFTQVSLAESSAVDLYDPDAENVRLAGAAQRVYAFGVVSGIVGIAPFVGSFLTDHTSISATTSFAVLWSLEPVLMLITDDLTSRARGETRSAANIAGWGLLALTDVLPILGLAMMDVSEDVTVGLLVATATSFCALQILTDVLGVRAYARARQISRAHENGHY